MSERLSTQPEYDERCDLAPGSKMELEAGKRYFLESPTYEPGNESARGVAEIVTGPTDQDGNLIGGNESSRVFELVDISDIPVTMAGSEEVKEYEGALVEPSATGLLVQRGVFDQDENKARGLKELDAAAGEEVTIGRQDEVTSQRFYLPGSVSREHVKITAVNGGYIIEDRNSKYGTTIRMPGEEAPSEDTVEGAPENSDKDPEAPERQALAPQVHDVLNEVQMLKSDIRETSAKVMGGFIKLKAGLRNVAGVPTLVKHGITTNVAQVRHERATAKREKAKEAYEVAAEKQNNSTSQIANWYHGRRAARKYQKYTERIRRAETARSRHEGRKRNLEGHKQSLNDRWTAAESRAGGKMERAEQYRTDLMEKAITAESRKALRKLENEKRRDVMRNNSGYGEEGHLSHGEVNRKARESITKAERQKIHQDAIRTLRQRKDLRRLAASNFIANA